MARSLESPGSGIYPRSPWAGPTVIRVAWGSGAAGLKERRGPTLLLLSTARTVVVDRRFYDFGANNVEPAEGAGQFLPPLPGQTR